MMKGSFEGWVMISLDVSGTLRGLKLSCGDARDTPTCLAVLMLHKEHGYTKEAQKMEQMRRIESKVLVLEGPRYAYVRQASRTK